MLFLIQAHWQGVMNFDLAISAKDNHQANNVTTELKVHVLCSVLLLAKNKTMGVQPTQWVALSAIWHKFNKLGALNTINISLCIRFCIWL